MQLFKFLLILLIGFTALYLGKPKSEESCVNIVYSRSRSSAAISVLWQQLLEKELNCKVQLRYTPTAVLHHPFIAATSPFKNNTIYLSALTFGSNHKEKLFNPKDYEQIAVLKNNVHFGLFVPDYSPATTIHDLYKYREEYLPHIYYNKIHKPLVLYYDKQLDDRDLYNYSLLGLSEDGLYRAIAKMTKLKQNFVVLAEWPDWIFEIFNLRHVIDRENIFDNPKTEYIIALKGFKDTNPSIKDAIVKLSKKPIDYQSYITEYTKHKTYPKIVVDKWAKQILSD